MFQAVRAEALPSQEIDGVERHHAVRAAAIRDDVAAFLQFAQTFAEFRERQEIAPGMCAATYSSRGRTSMSVTSPARTRRTSSSLSTGSNAPRSLEVLARDLLDFCQP